jgi:hypothetical protein
MTREQHLAYMESLLLPMRQYLHERQDAADDDAKDAAEAADDDEAGAEDAEV